MMVLAVQLYSLRQYLGSKEGVETIATKLNDMGIHHVQLSGFGQLTETNASWFEDVFTTHGISIIATHIDFYQLKREFEFIVAFHKRMKIPRLGIGALPNGYERDKVSDYQTFIFELNHLASKLQDHNIKLLYHNHSFEFVHHGPFIPFDIILQNMNTSQIELLPDLYWLQVAGVNPNQFIQQYHKFFQVVHIKDMRLQLVGPWETKPQFAPVGDGNMGYDEILPNLVKYEIPYIVIEQDDFYGRDPFNEIHRSVEYTLGVVNSLIKQE